jgi:tyrosinase
MTTSRRTVLLQGCVIGAGIIAANVPGIVALAQGQPKLRRSLLGMPLNDPIINAWRDAVGQLKARPASSPISWANFSAIHGTNFAFNKCPHRNWYFLPWHRAYLLTYERVVRQLTGFDDFALPYWDWTAQRQLPSAYTAAAPNPLLEPSRAMGPTDSLPDENVGSDVITQVMSDTPFETFGTTRPSGQNSTAQTWITTTTGIQGTLESNPHNSVHGIVGGVMASGASPLDPIFMMHHCNIDRIWWVWNAAGNANSGDPLWTGMTFQNHFFNPDGSPYSPKVSDLYTPETLGYTYDPELGAYAAASTGQATASTLDDKLKTIYATPNLSGANIAGIATYSAANKEQAIAAANKPLEIPVEVGANEITAVARYRRPSTGTEAVDPKRVQARLANAPRALCFIRDIAASKDQETQFRVFIDCDYLSASTPITDRHYVGTFSFFGDHGQSHGPGSNPSVMVDLTRPIQRVYGSAPEGPKRLRVQILPVPRGTKAGEIGTAKPGSVEIAIVTA